MRTVSSYWCCLTNDGTGYDRSKKPDAMMLGDLYGECGVNATARYFGVSRQTIYNWLDGYGIERTGRTPASEARRIAATRAAWAGVETRG